MTRSILLKFAAVTACALTLGIPSWAVAGDRTDVTFSDVFSFDPADTDVKGLSALRRTDNGVSMFLMTTDLAPGAYTLWWVVFNPGVAGMSVGYAAGHVVGPQGEATFAANLKQGEALSLMGSLADARESEIHLVVRYHGPVVPGRLYDQLHTFEPELATNVQFSVHQAP